MQTPFSNKAEQERRRKTEDARRRTNYGPSASYTPATDVHHVHHTYHDPAPSCDTGSDSGGSCGGGDD